jgi:hypothetical protein
MKNKKTYRPWGSLEWSLGLTEDRQWNFFGCLGPEERSVAAVIDLHERNILSDVTMLKILDTDPWDISEGAEAIDKCLKRCNSIGLQITPEDVPLGASLFNESWRDRFNLPSGSSLCLDISSLPKRFFFRVIKAVLKQPKIKDFMVVYTQPISYPKKVLSGNPDDWSTIPGFNCDDPDLEAQASSRLIASAGFAVEGLQEHLEGSGRTNRLDVLIPFPAPSWSSVLRSWESARGIEDVLEVDNGTSQAKLRPGYYRVGVLDTATAFDTLLRLTNEGKDPAVLAPLGPKPISVAMCLLAAQTAHYPVCYAQPKSYSANYSLGSGTIHAYWIKHDGKNLYAL